MGISLRSLFDAVVIWPGWAAGFPRCGESLLAVAQQRIVQNRARRIEPAGASRQPSRRPTPAWRGCLFFRGKESFAKQGVRQRRCEHKEKGPRRLPEGLLGRFLANLVVVQLPNSCRKATLCGHLIFYSRKSTPKSTPRRARLPHLSTVWSTALADTVHQARPACNLTYVHGVLIHVVGTSDLLSRWIELAVARPGAKRTDVRRRVVIPSGPFRKTDLHACLPVSKAVPRSIPLWGGFATPALFDFR